MPGDSKTVAVDYRLSGRTVSFYLDKEPRTAGDYYRFANTLIFSAIKFEIEEKQVSETSFKKYEVASDLLKTVIAQTKEHDPYYYNLKRFHESLQCLVQEGQRLELKYGFLNCTPLVHTDMRNFLIKVQFVFNEDKETHETLKKEKQRLLSELAKRVQNDVIAMSPAQDNNAG